MIKIVALENIVKQRVISRDAYPKFTSDLIALSISVFGLCTLQCTRDRRNVGSFFHTTNRQPVKNSHEKLVNKSYLSVIEIF